MEFSFHPITRSDEAFLLTLYASVRADEMALVPWTDEEKAFFLKSQFEAQSRHYRNKYPQALFQTIAAGGEKIGRLYLAELEDEIRIIDLTILPEARGKGFGTEIVTGILRRASKPVRIYLENFNRSVGLFRRLGFEVISDEGIYQLWECRHVGNKKHNAIA